MDGKLCVVSGSTSGGGYEAVKTLAAGGANIVMVLRNKNKAKTVKEESERKYSVFVDYFIADFSNLKQVEKAAKVIWDKYPRIDVLINSIGIHSTKRIFNEEGIKMVFCVNHLGKIAIPFLRNKELAPKGKTGLVVSVLMGYDFISNIKSIGFYEEFKNFAEEKIIAVLDRSIYENIQKKVIHHSLSKD